MRCQCSAAAEHFIQHSADIPGFLTCTGICEVSVCIGHVAQTTQHLKQTAVDTGYIILCFVIICVEHRKKLIGDDHHIGQGFTKFPGSQRQCLQLRICLLILYGENIHTIHTYHTGTKHVAGKHQGQVKTAVSECSILFCAGMQNRAHIASGFNQEGCSGRIGFDDDLILNAECRMFHQIQHCEYSLELFHDVPPCGGILCKNGGNFPFITRRDSTYTLILAKE